MNLTLSSLMGVMWIFFNKFSYFTFFDSIHFQRFDPPYLLQNINFYHNSERPNYFTIYPYCCYYYYYYYCCCYYYYYYYYLYYYDFYYQYFCYYYCSHYFIYLFHLKSICLFISIYLSYFFLIIYLFIDEGTPFGRCFNPGMLRVEGVS